MSNSAAVESIKREMLTLDPDERVLLAHTLAMSLEGLSRAQLNDLWLAEAVRRDAQMESGEVKGVPGDAVFAHIESRHAQ